MAWRATWDNFPLWLGVGLAFYALTVVSYLTLIGIVLLVPAFMWGGITFLLNMLDGRARFGDLILWVHELLVEDRPPARTGDSSWHHRRGRPAVQYTGRSSGMWSPSRGS